LPDHCISPWVYLVKGPATVTLAGTAYVFGKDVSHSDVSVEAGKILPFEIDSLCQININLDEGGESWLADQCSAGTTMWQEIVNKILIEKFRTILLIGDTDTGKSSLATFIVNLALKKNLKPAVIDADMGQGDLAPPTAIGGTIIENPITDLRNLYAQFFEFIGNTSPVGFEDVTINAIKQIVKKITTTDSDICIINTDGYIHNNGIDYKVKMAKKLRSDLVVCLGEKCVFESFRSKYFSLVLHSKGPTKTIKSRIERNQRRLNQFLRYIDGNNNNHKNVTIGIKSIKIVYRGITYSKILKDTHGLLQLGKYFRIKPWNLQGMFIGLGFKEDIVGFGIIKYVSAYKMSIQTKINYFNKIYLSHSGITEDRTLEFRIII
jgi:polynucleotide 5'-hydroxyl-kinase GRC3/NOL9